MTFLAEVDRDKRRGTPALGRGGERDAPCPWPRHRPTDWRLTSTSVVVCGVCHPPAVAVESIERVSR